MSDYFYSFQMCIDRFFAENRRSHKYGRLNWFDYQDRLLANENNQ